MRRLRTRLHRAVLLAVPMACSPGHSAGSSSSSGSGSSSSSSSSGGSSGSLGNSFCEDCLRQGLICDYWGTSCVTACSFCMCTLQVGAVGALDGGYPDGGLPFPICQAACPSPQGAISGCAVVDGGCSPLPDGGDGGSGPCVGCNIVDCSGSGRFPLGLATTQSGTPRTLRALLARSARLEALSVTAFEELALALRGLSAPAELTRRARRAAREETTHARLLAALLGAAPPRLPAALSRRATLAELARHNAIEGCLRETYGAAVAMLQARQARHPGLRVALKRIARDEASHAELSWDLAAWLEAQLDREERRSVRRAREHALESVTASSFEEPSAELSEQAGLPSARQGRALWAELRATVW